MTRAAQASPAPLGTSVALATTALAVLDLTALIDERGAAVPQASEPLGIPTVLLTSLRAHPSATREVHDVVTIVAKPIKERPLVTAVSTAIDSARGTPLMYSQRYRSA